MYMVIIKYIISPDSDDVWEEFDGRVLSTYPGEDMDFYVEREYHRTHIFFSEKPDWVLDFLNDSMQNDPIDFDWYKSIPLSDKEWEGLRSEMEDGRKEANEFLSAVLNKNAPDKGS